MVLFGLISGIVVSSIIFSATGFSIFGRFHEKTAPSGEANFAELSALAYSVLEHIADRDYAALSRVAHPEFGVVFSPSATITLSTNRRFSAERIAAFGTDNTVYVWGILNGSGEPIEMTPEEYFAGFIYNRNYASAKAVGINNIVRSGNALENIRDVFPNIQFLDFHIPGSNGEASEDFEWTSLRIGFEEYEGRLYLTLISQSGWSA